MSNPMDWLEAVVPDGRSQVLRLIGEHRVNRSIRVICRVRASDDEERWILSRGFPIRRKDGIVTGFAGVSRDITELKASEQESLHAERLIRKMLDASRDQLLLVDREGIIQLTNHAWRVFAAGQRFGFEQHGVGLRFVDVLGSILTDQDELKRMRSGVNEATGGGSGEFEVEHRIEEDGNSRWFELHGRRFKIGNRIFVLLSHREVTERKEAEARIRRDQAELAHLGRLSMLGEMATGIAHELNQPLSAIANYVRGCLDRLANQSAPVDALTGALEEVHRLALRSGEIISRTRRVALGGENRRSTVNVNGLVEEVAALLEHELRAREVSLRLDLDSRVGSLVADSIQIQQVITNLVMNGIAAMKDCPANRREIEIRTRQRRRLVEVSVSDRGPEFAKEDLKRMFEPFYSSKPGSLGMGLAISRGIIEGHGGTLRVERKQGVTRFVFTLWPEPGAAREVMRGHEGVSRMQGGGKSEGRGT